MTGRAEPKLPHAPSIMTMQLSETGGVLLFLADYPVEWLWLQLIAFAPLLWAVIGIRSALGASAYGV